MKRKPYIRFHDYLGDGMSAYQCMSCYTMIRACENSGFLYCPYCGVKFQGSLIRPRYYSFDVTDPKEPLKEWIVEHAIQWSIEDEVGEFSQVDYFSFKTPSEVLEFKKSLEQEEKENRERFISLSKKSHSSPMIKRYRVNLKEDNSRQSYNRTTIYVSDIDFFKRTGKHITECFPENTHYSYHG